LNFREEFIFWQLAEYFIADQGYRIIQLFENQKELWLEKLENKRVPIIRLVRMDLDWSSSLQRDIEFSAANGERIRKQVKRGELNLFNVIISQFPPVDDYEYRLEKPFTNPEGNKTFVHSILLTSADYEAGLKQLSVAIERELRIPIEEEYSEQAVQAKKKAALEYAVNKVKTEKAIFSNGKPFFTYLFMIIQLALFLWLEFKGGSTDTSTLIKYGAKFNFYIYEGEWWRFITPIFLHIGFLHLVMNTLSLYYLGTAVERMYGNFRFVFIYLFAGVAGFIASFLTSSVVSAGASGAIFGCFGALLYFGLIYPKLFSRTMGANLIGILIINIIIGFSVSSIDNAGHLGGLAGGFLAAGIVHFPKKKKPLLQLLFSLTAVSVIWGSLAYGFSDEVRVEDESIILLAQEFLEQENYEQAYELLKKFKENTKKPTAPFYFSLSFAEIKLGVLTDGKEHLQKAIELDPNFPEAYFNLALIFYEEGDLKQAREHAEKASKLEPEQQEYSNLVQELNRISPPSGGSE
jgi:rhomboid protease GluP